MVVSVSVVDPHDHMADWELQLTATAQHHEGTAVPRVPHVSSPGKDQKSSSNLKCSFC